ncbi:hypothetical protein HanXRQr2_Chr17g0816771 [Helianthus annuus]|nr:hypothetical protein HanXRQr2_Chr17g0816771 [Helianthus annuus]
MSERNFIFLGQLLILHTLNNGFDKKKRFNRLYSIEMQSENNELLRSNSS